MTEEPDTGERPPCGEEEAGELTVRTGDTYLCRRADGTYREAKVLKLRTNRRTKRQECQVHYAGLTRRQAEWVDKIRLVFKPAKEEEDEDDMEHSTEQKKCEDEETHNLSAEEGESEAKKVKLEASVMEFKDEEHTCMLCGEPYEDPVMVECGHSFCRSCIDIACASEDSLPCPGCNRVITEKKSTTDLMSDDMGDTPDLISESMEGPTTAPAMPPLEMCPEHDEKLKLYCSMEDTPDLISESMAGPTTATLPLEMCPEHDEKLKLYCKDDGILCCIICKDSLTHLNHKFLAVMDAVKVCKAELSDAVRPLEEALNKIDELSSQHSEKKEQLQNTTTDCRQHITSEFGNLYDFLKKRKEKLLEQLKEQSRSHLEEMKSNAAKMAEMRDSLRETIARAEGKVMEVDSFSFLDGIQDVLKTCREQKEASLGFPILKKELCRATFRGPIQYIAWKQMKPVCEPTDLFKLDEECTEEHFKATGEMYDECSSGDEGPSRTPEQPMSGNGADPGPTIPINIWIIGNMPAAKHRAESGPFGLNLGFDKETCCVHWWRLIDSWFGLAYKLKEKISSKAPDIILFYLGSKDLGRVSKQQMINGVKYGIFKCSKFFPKAKFIISTLLPKPEWLGTPMENLPWKFNFTLRKQAQINNCHWIWHQKLEKMLIMRYRKGDFRPLSNFEADLFLWSIRNVLKDTMVKKFKPSVEMLEELPFKDDPSEEVQSNDAAIDQPAPRKASESPITGPKEIWIIASCFMIAAKRRAQSGPLGLNLGFDHNTCSLNWWSKIDSWFSVFYNLKQRNFSRAPGIILFYLGSKELGKVKLQTIVREITHGIFECSKFFPKTTLIISTLLPKPEWQGTHVEDLPNKFNLSLLRWAQRYNFHLLFNHKLEEKLTQRYRNGDLSSLTDKEADLFLASIKDILEKAMYTDFKPSVEMPEQLPSKDGPSMDEQTEDAAIEPNQPSTGKAMKTPITRHKEIWIIGSGFMIAAKRRAQSSPLGLNLGFDARTCRLQWCSQIDSWCGVSLNITRRIYSRSPDIILFYLGSKDLERSKYQKIVKGLENGIVQCIKWFPKTMLIISTLLPTPKWLGTPVENRAKTFNHALKKQALLSNCHLLSHQELEKKLTMRYKKGNLRSFTVSEADQFLASIRCILEKTMGKEFGENDEMWKEPLYHDVSREDKENEDAAIEPDQPSAAKAMESSITKHKEIWIIGSGFITAAQCRAENGPMGPNLGFDKTTCTLHWRTESDTWFDAFPKLRTMSSSVEEPDIVLFYLSCNNLGHVPGKVLINCTMNWLEGIASVFPNTQFVLSVLLTEPEWFETSLDLTNIGLNSMFSKLAKMHHFHLLQQNDLQEKLTERNAVGDCSSLTEAEADQFLNSIRDALQKAMYESYKTGVKRFEIPPSIPSADTRPKDVWIVGNGFMNLAKHQAQNGSLGLNLGFDKQDCSVRWKNISNTWSYLFTDLKYQSRNVNMPDVLLFHFGNLHLHKELSSFICTVKRCLSHTLMLFPHTQFILSTLLPKPEHWNSKLEHWRKKLNFCFTQCAQWPRFQLLRHYHLEKTLLERYTEGRVSEPTESEIDSFLADIRVCLQKAIFQDFKPNDKKHCPSGDTPGEEEESEGAAIVSGGPPTVNEVSSTISKPKEIWIVASSFLAAANHRAETGPLGFNLGFDTQTCIIQWWNMGKSGSNLFPKLLKLTNYSKTPDIMLLYIGNFQLEKLEPFMFKKYLEASFYNFEKFYPNTEFIISQLLPKSHKTELVWLNEVNSFLAAYVEKPRFHLLRLEELEKKLLDRYAAGGFGFHNDNEHDLLIANIRDALLKAMNEGSKPTVENSEILPSGDGPSEKAQHKSSVIEETSSAMEDDSAVTISENVQPVTPTEMEEGPEASASSTDSENVQPVMPTEKDEGSGSSATSTVSENVQPVMLTEKDEGLEASASCTENEQLVMPREKDEGPEASASSKVSENVGPLTPTEKDEGPEASASSTGVARGDQRWISNVKAATDNDVAEGRKEIWIMGDSILRASVQAGKRYIGENFGFDEQRWLVRWMDHIEHRSLLLSEMQKISENLGEPRIVYLHVGSSDLEVTSYFTLLMDFRRDFVHLSRSFSRTQFIFSFILPKAQWKGDTKLEKNLKKFNLDISVTAKKWGFLVNEHKELKVGTFHFPEIFLKSIKLSIEKAIQKVGEPVTVSQEPDKPVLSTRNTLIIVVPGNDPAAQNKRIVIEKALGMNLGASTNKEDDIKAVDEVKTSETECHPPVIYKEPSCRSEDPRVNPPLPNISETECHPPAIKEPPCRSEDPGVDPPLPNISGVKQIWIVGNAYVCRAARQANRKSYGSNLGFEKGKWSVLWMGRVGMRWEALLPELNNALSTYGAPSIAFIHLGDNDLGDMPHDSFMKAMKDDLTQISRQFENTEFVFSTILPRAEWLTNGVEEQRQEINAALMEYAADVGFHVAVHEDIEETAIPRFQSGGSITISDSEYDLFVNGIKDAMEVMTQKVESPLTD